LTSDVRSAFGCQPDDGVRNLFRLREATERDALRNLGFVLRRGASCHVRFGLCKLLHTIGRGVTRCNVVDGYIVRAELSGKRTNQSKHARPYRIRKDEFWDRLLHRHRGNGHEPAPVSLQHVGQHRVREGNDATKVQLVSIVPLGHRRFEKELCRRTAGVGHAYVDTPETAMYCIYELAHAEIIGDVKGIRVDRYTMLAARFFLYL